MEPAVLSKFYLWWVIGLKSFPKKWTASDMTVCLDARGFPELRHLAWLSTFSKPSFMDSEGSSSEHANSSTSLSKISIWDRHPILSNIKGAKYLRVRDALTPSLSCWGSRSWHQFLDFKVNLPFAVVTYLFRSWSSLFFFLLSSRLFSPLLVSYPSSSSTTVTCAWSQRETVPKLNLRNFSLDTASWHILCLDMI